IFFFFFFSSRRRHTRFDCDWSSDVCSSDLLFRIQERARADSWIRKRWGVIIDSSAILAVFFREKEAEALLSAIVEADFAGIGSRSEERRVGKECRTRRGRERSERNER